MYQSWKVGTASCNCLSHFSSKDVKHLLFPTGRICCCSSFVTVNDKFLGGLDCWLDKRSIHKMMLWALGNCKEQFFHIFLTFTRQNDWLLMAATVFVQAECGPPPASIKLFGYAYKGAVSCHTFGPTVLFFTKYFLQPSAYSSHHSGLQRQQRQLCGARRSSGASDASWPKRRYRTFGCYLHIVCCVKLQISMFFFVFFNDNCMSLIYFQGLGLIANDSAATTAETGAFMNHKPAAFCLDVLYLSDACALSSPGVLTNPNLSTLCFFLSPCYPSLNLKLPFLLWRVASSKPWASL